MGDEQELMRQLACAGAHIDPGLSDRDVERLVAGARRRRRRRAVFRFAFAAVVGCAGVAALLVVHPRTPSSDPVGARPTQPRIAPLPEAAHALRLGDGSLATELDSESRISIGEESQRRISLTLVRGRGRFEVTPQPQRSFVVRAGDVTVSVVGTIFTVERVADRVGVAVERGRVRVDWGSGGRLLNKGESGWFPPLVVVAPSVARSSRSVRARTPRAAATASALDGKVAPVTVPRNQSAEDLLMAADAARLAGHLDEGAALLRRLLQDHRGDPRAPLAAFTLGRMLLMELGQPREAATVFAQVRQIAPHGSFAEDALAREVESWNQAGQPDLARARAQEYLRLFPGGRRTPSVKATGGIE